LLQVTRIRPIDPAAESGRTRELLDGVQKALGMTPNMMKTMAKSRAVLEGYLNFNRALSLGKLSPKFREQIALAVAQTNLCNYCLSAHTALGKAAGLQPDELTAARRGASEDSRTEEGLMFAEEVVRQHGQVADEAVARVRKAGYSDGEVAEIIAEVALNVFTNYFNLVALPEIDFPPVIATE
jgi:uncharacterized peroxidase-related enzyme